MSTLCFMWVLHSVHTCFAWVHNGSLLDHLNSISVSCYFKGGSYIVFFLYSFLPEESSILFPCMYSTLVDCMWGSGECFLARIWSVVLVHRQFVPSQTCPPYHFVWPGPIPISWMFFFTFCYSMFFAVLASTNPNGHSCWDGIVASTIFDPKMTGTEIAESLSKDKHNTITGPQF